MNKELGALDCIALSPVAAAGGYIDGYIRGWIATALLGGRNVWVIGTIFPKALSLSPVIAVATAIHYGTTCFLSSFMPAPLAGLIGWAVSYWGAATITHFPGGAWALFVINVKVGVVFTAVVLGACAVVVAAVIVGCQAYRMIRNA